MEATDGGGRKSQAIVVILATHSMFSLASIAPLPGMETFVPNPSAYMTTLATPTDAGKVIDILTDGEIDPFENFNYIKLQNKKKPSKHS